MFVYLYRKMNKTQQKITLGLTITMLITGSLILFI